MSALRRVGSWANDQDSSEGEDEDEEFDVGRGDTAPMPNVVIPNEVLTQIERMWLWSQVHSWQQSHFATHDDNTLFFICLYLY